MCKVSRGLNIELPGPAPTPGCILVGDIPGEAIFPGFDDEGIPWNPGLAIGRFLLTPPITPIPFAPGRIRTPRSVPGIAPEADILD